jgi:gas vesicle protein
MSEGRGSRSFIAFLLGGIIGLIGGLLLAPRSGKETREQWRKKGEELLEQGKETLETQRERLQEVAVEKSEKLRSRIEEAKERIKSGVDTAAEYAKEGVERIIQRTEQPKPSKSKEPGTEKAESGS